MSPSLAGDHRHHALYPSDVPSDDERAARQRLTEMLPEVLATNAFYRAKLRAAGIRDASEALADCGHLPFTTKAELSVDQEAHPPFGTNLTYPLGRYVRLHQTSGTTGRPLRILDTAESWRWWKDLWRLVYTAAGVTAADRIYFCFSFGPFIGFWSAFCGAEDLGALCIAGGAQSTAERLDGIIATGATVLACTPTYALRLAEVARDEGIDMSRSQLRISVHAGEPGASIPSTRDRIETAFHVRSIDHTGATEVGPTGFACEARDGVHLMEHEYVVEVIDPATGAVAGEGEGELVLTNLGRWGSPAIRYRTGDHVVAVRGRCECGRTLVKLRGGIVGRIDDMIVVRGVNVYPSSLEAIIRRFPEVEEFRLEVVGHRGMAEIRCVVESRSGAADGLTQRLATMIHRDIGIRCEVEVVEPGSLPRSDAKAKRVVHRHPAVGAPGGP